MKKVKQMMDGGVSAPVGVRPNMPPQSNAGGDMRGLDRAAAMSGRAMPTAGVGMRPAGMKKGGLFRHPNVPTALHNAAKLKGEWCNYDR